MDLLVLVVNRALKIRVFIVRLVTVNVFAVCVYYYYLAITEHSNYSNLERKPTVDREF